MMSIQQLACMHTVISPIKFPQSYSMMSKYPYVDITTSVSTASGETFWLLKKKRSKESDGTNKHTSTSFCTKLNLCRVPLLFGPLN